MSVEITKHNTSDSAATAAKTVACTGFVLITGAEVTVKFTVTNTASNPTLSVNSTGAKAIYYRGTAITAGYLAANRTYTFRYNGTQYELTGDINTDTNTNNAVTQTNTPSANADYRILMSATADDTTRTEGARKDTNLYYNPSTSTLTAGKITANTQDSTITFTSADSADPTAWTAVSVLAAGEKHSSLLNKLSTVVKNVRYLYKMLGNTDISSLGDGTVTGAISSLNTDLDTALKIITIESNTSIPAREFSVSVKIDVPAGYTALGILGWSTNYRINTIAVSSIWISSDGVSAYILGFNSGNEITIKPQFNVLLCKSVLL